MEASPNTPIVYEFIKAWRFSVPGPPMGKPRMTQRDVWKKRPVVLRYREYCDRIRAAAGQVPLQPVGLAVFAYLPVSPSWSAKKKERMLGSLMRQRPDFDNICKACADALFEEDSCLAIGTCCKFWCQPENARTDISIFYYA